MQSFKEYINEEKKHPALVAAENNLKDHTILAHHLSDNHVISITLGVPQSQSLGNHGKNILGYELKRHGRIHLTSPKGETLHSGFWMNFPEPEWKINKKTWQKMPLDERASLEVQHQPKYGPLGEQFKRLKENPSKFPSVGIKHINAPQTKITMD